MLRWPKYFAIFVVSAATCKGSIITSVKCSLTTTITDPSSCSLSIPQGGPSVVNASITGTITATSVSFKGSASSNALGGGASFESAASLTLYTLGPVRPGTLMFQSAITSGFALATSVGPYRLGRTTKPALGTLEYRAMGRWRSRRQSRKWETCF